ncbi:MAG: VWA domain-containing protein [Polyangiaceae bacterium]
MENNRKLGFLVLGGLLVATLGARAAYSLEQKKGELAYVPDASGLRTPTRLPRPWQHTADPGPALPPGEKGLLRLSTELDRTGLMRGGDGLVHVGVTLDTHGLGAGQRMPTDVVVVFDHSGSMNGQKLEYGKQALRELIGRLAPDDRLGLVAYASTADVRIPLGESAATGRSRWLGVVEAMSVDSGTNIGAGLDLGVAELGRGRTRGRATRMLLLSDGLANEGDTSVSGLGARAHRALESESVLSTVGIGSDFDENVMTALARQGAGAFYYLAKLETLPQLLSAELKTAGETYAQRAELHFKLGSGVKLVSASNSPFTQTGDTAVVSLGGLYGEYTQQLWLTLQVPTKDLGERELGSLSVRYTRDERAFEVRADALPKLSMVSDEAEFRRRIVVPVWERATIEEKLGRSKEQLGLAIGNGTPSDVDNVVAAVAADEALAKSLGSERVQQEIVAFQAASAPAKAAQASGGERRSVAAKSATASSFGSRNKAAYKNMAEYETR